MSSIINPYGCYTSPSYTRKAALDSLKTRSDLISSLMNKLFEMSQAPLKQKFEETPIELVKRTFDLLPNISDIARALYSDSTLKQEPHSTKETANLVNALTLPKLTTPPKQSTIKKLALKDTPTLKERCEKAIEYLYPKTLADHPWLEEENPPMPEDTQVFIQAALNGSKSTYGDPYNPTVRHLVRPLQIAGDCYISKKINEDYESQTKIHQPSLTREHLTNLLFAQSGDNITRVKAITADEIFFEHLAGGDLHDVLFKNKKGIPLKQFQTFCITLVNAFIEIESKRFCYADVKPENFFLSKDLTSIKLGDLGLTHPFTEKNTSGSPCYYAPEILQSKANNSTASDVFGFGVFLFTYLYQMFPEDLLLTFTDEKLLSIFQDANLLSFLKTIEKNKVLPTIRKHSDLYSIFFNFLVTEHLTNSIELSTITQQTEELHRTDVKKTNDELLAILEQSENGMLNTNLRFVITLCLEPNPADRPTWASIKEILSSR